VSWNKVAIVMTVVQQDHRAMPNWMEEWIWLFMSTCAVSGGLSVVGL
jgi:hypothetical protein